jgi:hypothetical protein
MSLENNRPTDLFTQSFLQFRGQRHMTIERESGYLGAWSASRARVNTDVSG